MPLKKLKDVYTQRKAYMEFMPRAEDDYPNLTVLIRLILKEKLQTSNLR